MGGRQLPSGSIEGMFLQPEGRRGSEGHAQRLEGITSSILLIPAVRSHSHFPLFPYTQQRPGPAPPPPHQMPLEVPLDAWPHTHTLTEAHVTNQTCLQTRGVPFQNVMFLFGLRLHDVTAAIKGTPD